MSQPWPRSERNSQNRVTRLFTTPPPVLLGSLTGDQPATLLDKDQQYLRNKHLIPMARYGEVHFRKRQILASGICNG